MTSLIDQRILIPAPTHVVWSVLADQNQLPNWRTDCHSVSVLTARQFGVGMRRRCVTPKGKDRLEEITAWYEGLGYEYDLVETRAYESWLGRIRLQTVPDGTIVQWTIAYQPAGFIRRLMNMFSGKATLEEQTANSLRQLRRMIEGMGYSVDGEPRRRQSLQPVASIVRSSTQPVVVPEGVSAADTKPRKPEGLQEAIAQQQANQAAEYSGAIPDETPEEAEKLPLPPGMPESLKATPPKGIPRVDVSQIRYADEIVDSVAAPQREGRPEDSERASAILPPPTSPHDTGEISIWEAFGIKPPSQMDAEALDEIVKKATGEHDAVITEAPIGEGDTQTFSPLITPRILRIRRMQAGDGLRLKQARQSVKVRGSEGK